MDGFYLLKPDMLTDKKAIKYYLEYIYTTNYISINNFYIIHDWITLSKLLYEQNLNNLSLEELKKIKKQLLTTIKAYDIFYKDKIAILSMIDIKEENRLQELYDFKKKLRKMFVYNTNKIYLKFNNELDLNKKLIDTDLNKINCNIQVVGPSEEIEKEDYNMVYFNKIHFPDPTISCIKRDLECIKECDIISEKNLVKKIL